MLEEQQLLCLLAMCQLNPKTNVLLSSGRLTSLSLGLYCIYVMLGTQPDITYAVTKLAQFAANPSKEHMSKAQYICHYLSSTPNYLLVYDGSGDEGIIAFTDSDWAADPIKRRSITGYFFKIAGGVFHGNPRHKKPLSCHPLRLSIWPCLTVVDKLCGFKPS